METELAYYQSEFIGESAVDLELKEYGGGYVLSADKSGLEVSPFGLVTGKLYADRETLLKFANHIIQILDNSQTRKDK